MLKVVFYNICFLTQYATRYNRAGAGDIGLLFALVDKRKKRVLQQLKNQKTNMLARASKTKMQLHFILRKQKSLKPLKHKIELPKEKE